MFAPLALSRLVLPGMREQGWGKIVNVSSMGGRFTFPGGGLYHASKYALEALSDAMRFELKGFGVDVILIEPGLIRTGFGAAVEREIGSATSDPRSVYGLQPGGRRGDRRRLREGTARAPRRTARGRRRDDRARARRQAPRARYTVTASAKALLAINAVLPDAGWDAMMRSSFPSPGKR